MKTRTHKRLCGIDPAIALLLATCLIIGTPATAGEEVQTLEELKQSVYSFLETQIPGTNTDTSIRIGRLDPRLRLARCADPLDVFYPSSSAWGRNMTVGVRCRKPKAWTIFVSARAIVRGPVVVASRGLTRGTVLRPQDVELQIRDTGTSPFGYFSDVTQATNHKLKRPVAAGKPIVENMLEKLSVVERGERVSIIAGSSGVSVRMMGKALESAALGETVRVRNLSSKRTVQGRVTAPGVVNVAL